MFNLGILEISLTSMRDTPDGEEYLAGEHGIPHKKSPVAEY